MNVLLIGSSTSLMNELIKKLNKEGHRVSILTGSYYSKESYERVFERYDFPYNCDSIKDIFASITPDLTICTGAFDKNFHWEQGSQQSVQFVSGMINLLTAYVSQPRGPFLFLSSDAVFDETDPEIRTEESPANGKTVLGMALTQTEELCRFFRSYPDAEVVVVRVNGYFCLPSSPKDAVSPVSAMCLEALRERRLAVNANRFFSLLDEADAVQFIFQIASAPARQFNCYHLSSGKLVSEAELGTLIQTTITRLEENTPKQSSFRLPPVQIDNRKPSQQKIQLVLDNQRFCTEFGIRRLNSLEKDVEDQITHMKANAPLFLNEQKERRTFFQWVAHKFSWFMDTAIHVGENVICFLLVTLLSRWTEGSPFFAKMDPFLLYVLVFSILYGQKQAILSAFLSTAGYLFGNYLANPAQGFMINYSTYAWIAQIFIVGMTVGYLKDQLSAQKDEAKDDHNYMARQVDDIREINDSNVRVKDALQTQIVNQNDSIGKIYEITSTLDQYSSDEVLFYAADVLCKIMGTEEVAIYLISQGPFARLLTATTENARRLGNSMKYVDLSLYKSLKEKKPFINRTLDESLPMMASMIYDGDDPRMIILIWTLPWEKMTLGQANLLTVTGALIQNAVMRANRYLEALRSDRFVGDTPILQEEAFISLLKVYKNAADKHLTEYRVLEILCGGKNTLEVGTAVASVFRPNDYLGESKDGRLFVLLSNTNDMGIEAVSKRIHQKGYHTSPLSRFAQERMSASDEKE